MHTQGLDKHMNHWPFGPVTVKIYWPNFKEYWPGQKLKEANSNSDGCISTGILHYWLRISIYMSHVFVALWFAVHTFAAITRILITAQLDSRPPDDKVPTTTSISVLFHHCYLYMNCTQYNTTHCKKVNICFHNSACWFHQKLAHRCCYIFVNFSKLEIRLDEFWPLAFCFFLVSIHQTLASSFGRHRILPNNLVAPSCHHFSKPTDPYRPKRG